MNAIDKLELDHVGELHAQLNDDHKQIKTLVDELIVPHTPRSTDELAVLLQELQNSLQKHISREQSPGGLYDYLGAFHPDYRCELGMMMLLKEHISMLSTIHDLTDRALSPETNHVGDTLALELYQGATDLSICLFEHELKENTIINRLAQSPQLHGQAMA